MAWHREDTKPLPESVVIQANGAYLSLSDWWSWLLHVLRRYIHTEKTVLFEHTRDTFTPLAESGQFRPSGWVGVRDRLTIFCKIPITSSVLPHCQLGRYEQISVHTAGTTKRAQPQSTGLPWAKRTFEFKAVTDTGATPAKSLPAFAPCG